MSPPAPAIRLSRHRKPRRPLAGSVLATDISPAILDYAMENARRAGYLNVKTKAVDGESLGVTEATFDAAVCRLGLMFFPDPRKASAKFSRR